MSAQAARRAAWLRENVEAIVVAVVLALLIRQYAIQAFVIPTGSMAPTLLGAHVDVVCPNCALEQPISGNVFRRARRLGPRVNALGHCQECERDVEGTVPEAGFVGGKARRACRYCGAKVELERLSASGSSTQVEFKCASCRTVAYVDADPRGWPAGGLSRGDRILVNNLSYRLEAPKRFDVAVFKFPRNPSENYIKRIVGLPGDTLDVKHGELYVDDRLARKPLAVQEAMWILVHDGDYVRNDDAQGQAAWELESGGWVAPDESADGVKVYRAQAGDKPAKMRYARSIRNWTPYNVFSNAGGNHVVGDVKAQFTALLGRESDLAVQLRTDHRRIEVVFRDSPQQATVLIDGAQAAQFAGLTTGTHDIGVAHTDSRLAVYVDGALACLKELDPLEATPTMSEVELVCAQGSVEVSSLRLYRDVFYLSGLGYLSSPFPFTVPDAHYFAFGDNPTNSKDSREWGAVPAGHLVGRAFGVFWPMLPGDFATRWIR